MTEQLPITIAIDDSLATIVVNIAPAINKLEAQFNFRTLTAGWYGEEDNLLAVHCLLVTSQVFNDLRGQQAPGAFVDFADDVFCIRLQTVNQLNCIIALTDTELALFNQHKKLMTSYLEAKIQKVLNLIAEQENLMNI